MQVSQDDWVKVIDEFGFIRYGHLQPGCIPRFRTEYCIGPDGTIYKGNGYPKQLRGKLLDLMDSDISMIKMCVYTWEAMPLEPELIGPTEEMQG